MKSTTSLVVALTLALMPAACGAGDSRASDRWQAVVDTVGDTITVRTVSGSVWGDTVSLEPEVSIGEIEGADEYLIGDPGSIAVGPDGTVYVLDAQVPVLRAYAPDGTYLRDLGRHGGGPGEYENPDGMTSLRDGRVLVRDPGGARIVVFDADGAFVEQWPLSGGFNTSSPLYSDTLGQVYTPVLFNPGTPPWEWVMGLRRYSATGEPGDTLPVPTWDFQPARLTASRKGSSSSSLVPFTARASWTFSPLGYMVGGVSRDYQIDFYRSGAPVIRVARDYVPVPVQSEEADERRVAQTERFERQYGSWRWNGPPIPDVKPPFREMFTSREGNVWVMLSQPGRPAMSEQDAKEEQARTGRRPYRFEEPAAFDVFAPDGRYLGHVRVPESFRTDPEPVVIGDHVWAVTRDDLDVATVVRFRMVHEGAGAGGTATPHRGR